MPSEMEVLEVESRMGLLINSLSEYKDVYTVLLKAVQMLVREFSTDKSSIRARGVGAGLDQTDPRSGKGGQCDQYVVAFVKAGAVVDAVDAIDLYSDKPELVGAILLLFIAMQEIDSETIAAGLDRSGKFS